jgi:hypothetical protein
MKHFQVLLLTLLTAITFELGSIVAKLPTPEAHAAPPAVYGPALEDPHDTLKRQIGAVQAQIAKLDSRVNDDSKRLLITCTFAKQALDSASKAYPTDFSDAIRRCTARGWNASLLNNFDIPFGP